MKRNLVKITLCLSLLLVAGVAAEAAPRKWNYVQSVKVDREGPVKVNLPYETVDKAQPDLSDLRLVNSDGQMVPFYLQQEKPEKISYRKIKTYDVARSETQTVVNVVTGVEKKRIDALKLNILNRKFLKSVVVESSEDYESWKEISRGTPIFGSAGGPSNTLIELPPGKRKYLRLVFDDRRSTPVEIKAIRIRTLPSTQPPTRKLKVAVTDRREVGKRSILDLRLPHRNLPLLKFRFSVTEPVFKREVALFQQARSKGITQRERVGGGTIFRFRGKTAQKQRLAVPVNYRFKNRRARLIINNRDKPPLELEKLSGLVPQIKLVFWARQPGTYRLLAGNRVADRPEYQLGWLRDYVETMQLSELQPGDLRENRRFRPPEELPELPTRGAKLVPDQWKYRKKLELRSSGIKWLELPPAVLAHSGRSQQDLRLLTGQYQIPYVLDERTLTRTFSRKKVNISRRQQGTSSRYKFELPYPRLPLFSISARVDEALYEREVVLFEKNKKRPGKSNRRVLGRSTWKRTPSGSETVKRIYLRKRPRTAELYLEIDNKDNAPLELSKFNFNYKTHRLFFKTEEQQPVYLYYGNQEASAPEYDIRLVKTSLLNSQAQKVQAGPEERLTPAAWWEFDYTGSTSRVIFTVVIIFVTAALLFIIARLLPEVEVTAE